MEDTSKNRFGYKTSKNVSIGLLAHVDAGKTTFSEQLLYQTGLTRTLGKVDDKTSIMDSDEIEKQRGITIFSDMGRFFYQDDCYYLIDTPGHMDFSTETERAVGILDYAILLISGTSGVQAHTVTLFRLLEKYNIPVFFFINKIDIETVDIAVIMEQIKNKLTINCINFSEVQDVCEFVAERDETCLEDYLEGNLNWTRIEASLKDLIKKREAFPVFVGSALKNIGIEEFLESFSRLTETNYGEKESNPFLGQVYKIKHDSSNNPIIYIKILEGTLSVKDEFTFYKQGAEKREKINEIRKYCGNRYENVNKASAGDVVAVTGLRTAKCGMLITYFNDNEKEIQSYYMESAIGAKVSILDGTSIFTCTEKLRILEKEDPMLSLELQEGSKDILVHAMGKVQLEVLEQIMKDRFGIRIQFDKPTVQYKETINQPVIGYGHFEPLRHYAEVKLRLEPQERGSGITFASECHIDTLSLNWQRLIETHIFEKQHKGVLTGSPITDMKIVLENGRCHIKHTEGGDFREAAYRAIRQGLEKADSCLLEPFYQFEIFIEEEDVGRVISDIQRLGGTFEGPFQYGSQSIIRGKGPVEAFMDYNMELVSFTKGKGSISFLFDGYYPCENWEHAVQRIGYDKDADVENTSSSVFCSKGISYVVKWNEADAYMHTSK